MRPQAGGGFFVEAAGFEEAAGFVSDLQREFKVGLRNRLKEASGIVSREAAAETHSARVRGAMGFNVEVKSLTEFEARIGPSRRRAWFAHFLEFGTVRSRAFPFLAPALATTEDQVVEIVGIPPVLNR